MRFPIRFTGINTAMVFVGITPGASYVDVADAEFTVQLGWAFRATASLSSIRSAAADDVPVWGWGAHVWRGVWLINGSSSGIVRIELDEPARGRYMCFAVKPRVLRIAVEDPDGLLAALGSAVL